MAWLWRVCMLCVSLGSDIHRSDSFHTWSFCLGWFKWPSWSKRGISACHTCMQMNGLECSHTLLKVSVGLPILTSLKHSFPYSGHGDNMESCSYAIHVSSFLDTSKAMSVSWLGWHDRDPQPPFVLFLLPKTYARSFSIMNIKKPQIRW